MGTEQPIVLRNYAYTRRDKKVYAECIDLDIAVVRDSMQEAVEALNDAVVGYLKTAASQGWYEELIPRPSPFRNRLKYHINTLLFHLEGTFRSMRENIKVYSNTVTNDSNLGQPTLTHA